MPACIQHVIADSGRLTLHTHTGIKVNLVTYIAAKYPFPLGLWPILFYLSICLSLSPRASHEEDSLIKIFMLTRWKQSRDQYSIEHRVKCTQGGNVREHTRVRADSLPRSSHSLHRQLHIDVRGYCRQLQRLFLVTVIRDQSCPFAPKAFISTAVQTERAARICCTGMANL